MTVDGWPLSFSMVLAGPPIALSGLISSASPYGLAGLDLPGGRESDEFGIVGYGEAILAGMGDIEKKVSELAEPLADASDGEMVYRSEIGSDRLNAVQTRSARLREVHGFGGYLSIPISPHRRALYVTHLSLREEESLQTAAHAAGFLTLHDVVKGRVVWAEVPLRELADEIEADLELRPTPSPHISKSLVARPD